MEEKTLTNPNDFFANWSKTAKWNMYQTLYKKLGTLSPLEVNLLNQLSQDETIQKPLLRTAVARGK